MYHSAFTTTVHAPQCSNKRKNISLNLGERFIKPDKFCSCLSNSLLLDKFRKIMKYDELRAMMSQLRSYGKDYRADLCE